VNRANIDTLACPPETRGAIAAFVGQLEHILGDDLAAVWVHGSLAHGCFNTRTSDVDLLVVIERQCAGETADGIARAAAAAETPIDAAFVTRRQLESDEYPAPVEFLLKRMGEVRIVRPEDGSRDFLLQRQDALEAGAALFGPPPGEIIRPVPWHILRMSLDYLFGHIAERFKDPVLMFCRIAYAFANARLCSKKQAGEWALDEFGAAQSDLIKRSLAAYSGHEGCSAVTDDEVRSFERYCADYIAALGK